MRNIKILLLILSFIAFLQCGKEDKKESISFDQHVVTITRGDTKQLNLIYSADDLKGRVFNWSSSDENVVTVSTTGLLTGIRIGETRVTVSSSNGRLTDTVHVILQPEYNLFKEPYFGFGASMAVVKANETRELLSDESGLGYLGENENVLAVIYTFTDDAMDASCVVFNLTAEIAAHLSDCFAERYEPIMEDNGAFYFRNSKGVIAVFSINESMGPNVIYFEESNLKATMNHGNSFKKVVSRIEDLYSLSR